MKELHQSNSKSAIHEIREKLKAIIDCEDTDFSDFVDAVAHDYDLPAVTNLLLHLGTNRPSEPHSELHQVLLTALAAQNPKVTPETSTHNVLCAS